MSLLLEALKKAEKAKEEAQRRARAEGGGSLRLEGETAPPPAAEPKPAVLTRPELPDIKQPLEILTDDIAPKEAPAQPVPPPPPPPQASPPRPSPQPKAEPQAPERATAKKVFEAKFKEPNPRLPFFIVLGILGAFAVGTVGYFWYQLRPPPPLVNSNPTRTGNEVPAPQVAHASPAAAPAAAPAAPAQPIPGLPSNAAPAAPAPAPATSEPQAQAKPKPAPRAIAPPPAPKPAFSPAPVQAPVSTVATTRPAPQVHPKVDTAYAAYLKSDFAAARSDYQEALRDDPANRDALLGLAAIDVRSGRFEVAEATYLKLLQADPNDAHAQAGLIALRGARLDPLATESRVKSMLAADPGASVLHFTLGNQLAQQGRWPEAQQEYFKAFAASPDNADFAYNLAVSLDHLRQDKLALEYYQRALALAATRGASFDLSAARARAGQLAGR
jgi:Flp pilus assembly protein TadD